MNSLINSEIRNHPERLIEMYKKMLGGNQCTLPSGHAIPEQETARGFITVDLINDLAGQKRVFRDIPSGDRVKTYDQKKRWKSAGIAYTASSIQADRFELSLPGHGMNDILFVHFFQASRFGH
jgi:hypothetical protein